MIMDGAPYVASIDINSLPQVIINGSRIKYVDCVKNLGVSITSRHTRQRLQTLATMDI